MINSVIGSGETSSTDKNDETSNSHEQDIAQLMTAFAPIDEQTVLYVYQHRAHCELEIAQTLLSEHTQSSLSESSTQKSTLSLTSAAWSPTSTGSKKFEKMLATGFN